MSKKLLMSRETQKETTLKAMGQPVVHQNGQSVMTTASSQRKNLKPDAALINGDALLAQDAAEYEVLLAARQAGLPIVLENANRDAVQAVAGIGLEADVAVIHDGPDGVRVMVPPAVQSQKLRAGKSQIDEADTAEKQTSVESADDIEELPVLQSGPVAGMEQVANVLDELTAVTPRPMGIKTAAAGQSNTPEPYTYYLGWEPYEWEMKWPDGTVQRPNVGVDFKIQMIATNNPYNKFLIITSSGSISPGEMHYDKETARGYYLEKAKIIYGPQSLPTGMTILNSSPDNNNNKGSYSIAKGFEIGGSLDKDGPGVSGSYNESEERSIPLQDFNVENKMNRIKGSAHWTYNLASVLSKPYKRWSDMYAGAATFRWLEPPSIARNGFQPVTHSVWRVPDDFNETVTFEFFVEQTVRLVWLKRFKNVFGMTVRSEHFNDGHFFSNKTASVTIDFSKVQPLEIVEPITVDNLVKRLDDMERRLGILENFMLSQTPAAKHTVRPGENLTMLALRYYGSAKKEYWMAIFEANRTVLAHPSKIYPGQKLIIPRVGKG
ncbi:MAG: leukocidin family pore-forming toxin [Anaerolineales bacterium]|nr:leukocidin family pore-forming toxin [Anaerolineales bacterium]